MKNMLFKVIILGLSCLASNLIHGQESNRLHGRITDDKGLPLAGAGVFITGTGSGTYSDNSGYYSLALTIKGEYTVRFFFTGYEAKTERIFISGEKRFDVSLSPSAITTGEILVSATRAGVKSPFTYSSVGTEALRKQDNSQDLPYLIGMTPSLVETSESGTGLGYTNLRIRGSDANRINVTLDGIPLNDAESQQVFWVDLPDLASSIDNIQVQRGVGTSTNGAGAFGASVNMLTVNPSDSAGAEVNFTAGSFNTLRTLLKASTGVVSNHFSFDLRLSDIKSDGYIYRTGISNQSARVAALYRTARSFVKANVILGKEHTGISWWGVPKEMLRIDRRYNPAGEYTDENGMKKYYDNESDNYNQDHYQLLFSHSPGDRITMNAAFHYTRGSGYYEEFREDQSYSEYGLENVTVNSSEITETDLIRRKWLRNDFYGLVTSMKVRAGKNEIVFGAAANRYDGDHFGKIIWMKYAGSTPENYTWYLNQSAKKEISSFIKLNTEITPSLNGLVDLQYRYIDYTMTGPDDDAKSLDQQHSYNFFNPKAGLYYSIAKGHDAFASFAVAHREPTRSDFKEAAGDPSATPEPETLFDTEIGYNFRSSHVNAGVTVYWMYYKNQLIPTGELSDVGYTIMTNVDKSYRLGIELTGSYKPSDKLALNMNLTLSRNRINEFVAYYTDYNTADWSSEYLSMDLGDVDIAYSPRVISSGEITYSPSSSLDISLVSKYVGKQYFDNTMSEDRKLDPYFVTNFRLSFNPEIKGLKGLEVQLYINNLLDNVYENNAYGGFWYENGKEKTWSYFFPQAGKNFLLRAGIKF
ncbi:MAG: TonB-dependent receptor [Bacteroidales bacterium]